RIAFSDFGERSDRDQRLIAEIGRLALEVRVVDASAPIHFRTADEPNLGARLETTVVNLSDILELPIQEPLRGRISNLDERVERVRVEVGEVERVTTSIGARLESKLELTRSLRS